MGRRRRSRSSPSTPSSSSEDEKRKKSKRRNDSSSIDRISDERRRKKDKKKDSSRRRTSNSSDDDKNHGKRKNHEQIEPKLKDLFHIKGETGKYVVKDEMPDRLSEKVADLKDKLSEKKEKIESNQTRREKSRSGRENGTESHPSHIASEDKARVAGQMLKLADPEAAKDKVTVSTLRTERSKMIQDHFGYTNEDNPFSDRLLAEPFVWKKRNVVLQVAGQKRQTTAKALLETSKNKIEEIENVKKRREEREIEEKLLEDQRDELKREKDRLEFEDYAAKESVFYRQMQIKKTELRVEQGREKPIDLIIKGLRLILGDRFENLKILTAPASALFEASSKIALDEGEVEDFIQDVKIHINSCLNDIDRQFQPFWKALLVVAKDGLQRHRAKGTIIDTLKNVDSSIQTAARAAQFLANEEGFRDESGVNLGVAEDIEQILRNKTTEELDEMEEDIKEKLEDEDCDTTYWEAIVSKIPLYKAKAICAEMHVKMTSTAKEVERQVLTEKAERELAEAKLNPGKEKKDDDDDEEEDDDILETIEERVSRLAREVELEVNPNLDGRYSPELEPFDPDEEFLNDSGNLNEIKEQVAFDEGFSEKETSVNPEEDAEKTKKDETKEVDYVAKITEVAAEKLPKKKVNITFNLMNRLREREASAPVSQSEKSSNSIKGKLNEEDATRVEKNDSPFSASTSDLFTSSLSPYSALENPKKKKKKRYVKGLLSPLFFPGEKDLYKHFQIDPEEEIPILDEVEDAVKRKRKRALLIEKEKKKRKALLELEEIDQGDEDSDVIDPAAKIIKYEDFVRKEKKTMTADDEVMAPNAEIRLKALGLDEKYRACKPRYFNRVRTGYYWNKYNQTHYDHDNPPPKGVQGYRFNIFYPDLVDKNKTPTWTLEKSDTPDTIILRFHAGPPYEDVAFKILNREWHLEKQRGFRSMFDRGILQLYFSFKKYVYRR